MTSKLPFFLSPEIFHGRRALLDGPIQERLHRRPIVDRNTRRLPTAIVATALLLVLLASIAIWAAPNANAAAQETSAPAAGSSATSANPEIPADSALQIMQLKERVEKDPYDGEAYTKLGILYTQEKMYEEARSAFISAIQCGPGEALTHLNLAVLLIKMEKWQEAIQPLTAFNTLAPDDGRGYVLLGDIQKELGNLDEARNQWETGLALPGVSIDDKAQLLRRLVASYREQDDLEGAIAVLEKYDALLQKPSFDDLRQERVGLTMKLAKDAETAGETGEALEWMKKARDTGMAPATAWTAATEILLKEGRQDEVEALAKRPESAPKGTIAYIRGRLAETRGDLPAAARYYKEALAADPDYPGTNSYLGGVLAQLGDVKGAERALARASARGEGGAAVKYNQAVMKSKAGDYRGAIPLLEQVVKEDPSRKDAYRALALAYRKTKNYRKAASVSQKLVDTFGPTPGDLYQLAYAQAKSGNYADAADNYETVTLLEPENFNAFYGLGRALVKLGRNDDAIKAFSRAVELQPENEIAVFNLAFVYQKASKYSEAIDVYLEASDLKETARSCTNIAICYQKLGDKDAADEYYKKADDLKKGHSKK